MIKYKVISINLQQTLIVVDEPITCCVRAVYTKHNGLLILNPVFGEDDEETILDLCQEIGINPEHIMYGDGFQVDTWDEKIKKYNK
jgi:hypothetical protein